MSYFRGKMRQYSAANDRFNITLAQALLYRPTSGTIQDMKNHPLVLCARGPPGAPRSTPVTPVTPSCPPISLSDIATVNGNNMWTLKGNTTILACQTLIIEADFTINAGNTLENRGTIIVNGNIYNNGEFNNTNNSVIRINGGSIDNLGEINNDSTSTIYIYSGGVINNYGPFQNSGKIYVYDSGVIDNNDTVQNSGDIIVADGTCGIGTITGEALSGNPAQTGCPP